jgi:hypothetical protein
MKISWNYVCVFCVLIWCEVSYLLMLLFVKSLICSLWFDGMLDFVWCIFWWFLVILRLYWGYIEVILRLYWGYVNVILLLFWIYVAAILVLCWCYVDVMLMLCWCYVDVTLILFWWLSGFEFVQLCLCKCAYVSV